MITVENPPIYSEFFQIYSLKVLNEISKRKFSNKVLYIKLMIELNSTYMYLFALISNMMYFRNISMRTSTNFYLFNLALADVIIILMDEFFQINTFA